MQEKHKHVHIQNGMCINERLCDFIHNDPNVLLRVKTQIIVHLYNRILLSNKKELTTDTRNNIDRS